MNQTDQDMLKQHLLSERNHDAAGAAACYAEDGWYEHVALGLRFDGRDAVEAQYASSYTTFPDLDFKVEREVFDESAAVQWGQLRGTAAGEFLGQPATGRRIDVPMTAIYEIYGGAIRSERVFLDLATLVAQAGWDLYAIRDALGLDAASSA